MPVCPRFSWRMTSNMVRRTTALGSSCVANMLMVFLVRSAPVLFLCMTCNVGFRGVEEWRRETKIGKRVQMSLPVGNNGTIAMRSSMVDLPHDSCPNTTTTGGCHPSNTCSNSSRIRSNPLKCLAKRWREVKREGFNARGVPRDVRWFDLKD